MTESGGYQRKRGSRRIVARVEKGLGTLQPGETVESAVWGHRYVPGLQVLLLFGALGDSLYLLLARPYYVVLTNQRFMLLHASRFLARTGKTVYTVPPDQARLELGRSFVLRKIATVGAVGGDEVKIAVHRQFWGELDYMASLLSGRAA